MSIRCPKGETVCTSYYDSCKELLFVITSKPAWDYYVLYEVVEGEFKRLGKAKSPAELEEKFKVRDKMLGRFA